eukprot:GHVP01026260.1.p1 GENE.GHVP01026260.1~~GHVP01026260.1.p1  ORF type:complete len:297 (+),score=73.58 GHVP01026260.1:1139-2029(+)
MIERGLFNPEKIDVFSKLVYLVGRKFYNEEHGIALDVILKERVTTEDLFAEKLDITQREASIILSKLKNDRLIKILSKSERTEEGKPGYVVYFYMDQGDFVDLIRYKLYLCRKELQERAKNEAAVSGYKCSSCKKIYNELDVKDILNMRTGLLECEVCHIEVQERDKEDEDMEEHQGFIEETEDILACLKELETTKFEPLDIEKEIVILKKRLKGEDDEFDGIESDDSLPTSNESSPSKSIKYDSPEDNMGLSEDIKNENKKDELSDYLVSTSENEEENSDPEDENGAYYEQYYNL